MIKIQKYPDSRYWAIIVDGDMLALTVYKKGAEAIKNVLNETSKGQPIPMPKLKRIDVDAKIKIKPKW